MGGENNVNGAKSRWVIGILVGVIISIMSFFGGRMSVSQDLQEYKTYSAAQVAEITRRVDRNENNYEHFNKNLESLVIKVDEVYKIVLELKRPEFKRNDQ